MGKTTRRQPTQTPTQEEGIVKTKKQSICSIVKKKTKQKFLSESQRIYYETLLSNQITICSGPAGVGKSYIAMKCAVDLLSDPNTPYEKIIIVRPAVEAEEKFPSSLCENIPKHDRNININCPTINPAKIDAKIFFFQSLLKKRIVRKKIKA